MANTQISQPGTTGLPTLHPLAEAAPADWALPQTLEPNATMSYRLFPGAVTVDY